MFFKKVLVVNDDGYEGEGIHELVEKTKAICEEVLVVCPFVNQSATSHSMTIQKGMKLVELSNDEFGCPAYALNGTPTDCVKFALLKLEFKPDVVFSGCNNGLNLGNDILYSGTVAGASEANFFGIRGISFSVDKNDFTSFNHFNEIIQYIFDKDLFQASGILNINIPPSPVGIRVTHQGRNPFDTQFVLKEDGMYYACGVPLGKTCPNDEYSDVKSFYKGYISITPLTINRTDISIYQVYKELNQSN
jgi:5'-nucleotidase